MKLAGNIDTPTNSSASYDAIARRLLAAHPAPDLRGITVILPNYHVARPLARALIRGANCAAILLPQMVTLNEWAQRIPVAGPVAAVSQRGALLYQHLRKHSWFDNAELWSMTQELLTLFDELTYTLCELPADAESFAAAVQDAYQARQNAALQLEARLVFELWHAMQAGDGFDQAHAYQQRLAKLAAQADRPLYVLRTSDWEAVEQRFLDEYQKRAAVHVFDLREMDAQTNTPHFFAASSLEMEARAAAMQVRIWLQAGKRNIAIVAQDRVAARRTRALLERFEVLVADETGWTLATLSVSSVIDRWLMVLQSDFYHHDLLDLMKSPYIFADLSVAERKTAVFHLENLLRKQGVVSGLDNFCTLAEHEAQLRQPMARLREAAGTLPLNARKTLGEWLTALCDSLTLLGIDVSLQRDDAGRQMLHAIACWQQELHQDTGRYRFPEWRRWLAQQLDTETYRDSSIDSEICFTHLAATRWRRFDAVILLGCDAEHLPGRSDGGRWFNDAVRSSLQLTTRGMRVARQRDDLLGLLALNDCVLVTWQKDKDGEAQLLSPYLQILRDEYQQMYGDDRSEVQLHAYLAAEEAQRVALPPARQPAPTLPPDMIPDTVSISGYNALVACPYQFYARHVLRLNELDEVQETMEKRDYGERVHLILQRFHEHNAHVAAGDRDEMIGALREISEDLFSDLLPRDFSARAWLARWYKSLPAYVDWQIGNESLGWGYSRSEQSFNVQLQGARLRGRIDRVDDHDAEKLVLDYKTQGETVLRNKLKQAGEDVQLACYAYAADATEAAFVSIDSGKVRRVAPADDVRLLAQLNAERLEQLMTGMLGSAPLVANGIDVACGYCEMRGLCRKGEWL